jgi:predicted NAD/FAD-binding protein
MPFEFTLERDTSREKPSVAIVGSGIAGLGAAWQLKDTCQVTVFEGQSRLGGHARTLLAGPEKNIPVDTGFMVFNDVTYPNLVSLFDELQIPSLPAPMSFAVSIDEGEFEYGLTNLSRLFADRRNLVSPRFYRLLADIMRFNAEARATVISPDMTIGSLLRHLRIGKDFSERYLYPLAGAIWSTARDDMEAFPADTFVRFFENHGLLTALTGPKWKTVAGGSKVYVERLVQRLAACGVSLQSNCPVEAAGRHPDPWLKIAGLPVQKFDHIILACHSDQALALLTDATRVETEILGAIRYRPNEVILHSDVSQMPRRRAAWSSWVYKGTSSGPETSGSFTYWMNALQSLPEATPLFVTLNPKRAIDDHLVYDREVFRHPQFDLAAIRAQERLADIQGHAGVWFCGAWTRFGFHEDGLQSGLSVSRQLLETVGGKPGVPV